MVSIALVHLSRTRRRAINPDEVFLLEAEGEETVVHLSRQRKLRDSRRLGELLPAYERFGTFVRVHRNHAVNLTRIFELRKRQDGQDWELRLEPAKNRVLPISRQHIGALWEALGER